MLKTMLNLTVISAAAFSSTIFAQIEYEVQDIGTLQTHSSEALAINNEGQILGWYNLDGSRDGKHFFVRDRDGNFTELPNREKGMGQEINWRYLVDGGKAYGTYDGNSNYSVLYMWDSNNDVTKLGNLPGKEISAINNNGQVLIKSVLENESGKSVRRPVIWHNGVITKLRGLEGNIGIESDESYGLDMNNNGDVVGKSVVYINYKNNLYKQVHAAKWINGQPLDLHQEVPKCETTIATTINDLGEIIINKYLIRADGQKFESHYYQDSIATNNNYFLGDHFYLDKTGQKKNYRVNKDFQNYDCIWMGLNSGVDMNDHGEIIAKGYTIYGENHAMLLIPVNSEK